MSVTELFWTASVEELKCGFSKRDENFICLLCGKKTEKGIIYHESGTFYDAEKYMSIHIEKEHQSVFEHLINLDKRLTGLSDHQNSLLRLFYQGKSDAEVQKETGIGSSSTIRNHRFVLKEKERQAKIFLVLMELLKAAASKKVNLDKMEGESMDRRKELKQQYKEMKTEGGIYQIRNTKNQKVFLVATPNFKTINGRNIELEMGGHKNRELQEEWNQFGKDAFVFEVLETLEEKEDVFFDKAEELKKLEQKWLGKLQPYGVRGYNKEKNT